jgi:hypothetical protein
MNLWVNRLRQLALLAVALFFFACEDETSLLGFRNPNTKFKGQFIDIDLTTSVLQLDSIRTSNGYFLNEYNRLLVGKYTDPEIGVVQSNAVAQFFTGTVDTIANDAQIDSVYLYVHLDLYTYGSKATSSQKIAVYEASEQLTSSDKRNYTGNKQVQYDLGSFLGEQEFTVNPDLYEEQRIEIEKGVNTDKDPNNNIEPVLLKFKLPETFRDRLAQVALRHTNDRENDTVFVTPDRFVEEFKGLAFVSSSETNDKILGVSTGSLTRIVMHYQTPRKDSLEWSFYFYNGLAAYSNVQVVQKSAKLATLEPWEDDPLDGTRFVQSGTGLMTKIDLSNFYEFAERDSVKDILINSAELVIDDVVAGDFRVPTALAMRSLRSNNRLDYQSETDLNDIRQRTLWGGVLAADYLVASGTNVAQRVIAENDSTLQAITDVNTGLALTYSSSKEQYSGFLTLFFQRLHKNRNELDRYTNFVLYPTDVSQSGLGAKSVNRAVFSGQSVHLRLYYTKFTIN